MGYWTNKVVMITGASSGIGRGVALEIAARGASLGLLARREELLQEIVNEAESLNVRAISAGADVRDAQAVREAADRFRKELGSIDVLIANAGIVFSREALLSRVWKDETYVTVRSVDTLVKRLRKKIEQSPAAPAVILTVWGAGYKAADV